MVLPVFSFMQHMEKGSYVMHELLHMSQLAKLVSISAKHLNCKDLLQQQHLHITEMHRDTLNCIVQH